MCLVMGCYNERAGKLATEALLQIQNSTCLMFAALSRQWLPIRPRWQSCLAHPRIVPAFWALRVVIALQASSLAVSTR